MVGDGTIFRHELKLCKSWWRTARARLRSSLARPVLGRGVGDDPAAGAPPAMLFDRASALFAAASRTSRRALIAGPLHDTQVPLVSATIVLAHGRPVQRERRSVQRGVERPMQVALGRQQLGQRRGDRLGGRGCREAMRADYGEGARGPSVCARWRIRCRERAYQRRVARARAGRGARANFIAGVFPLDVLAEVVSFGTLVAFTAVCASAWRLRVTHPDVERPFRVPWFPFVPALGMAVCAGQLLTLPLVTWENYALVLALGGSVYVFYGRHHSTLGLPSEGGTAAAEEDSRNAECEHDLSGAQ